MSGDSQPHTHDSAGQTFGGRSLEPTGFEGDDGTASEALVIARANPLAEREWMAALAQSRFLVPVVAVPGEVEEIDGRLVEKTSDMAMVTLTAPDGQRALPVFTGTYALTEWDESARPIPVEPMRAAQAAISENCDVIVVDVAGPDSFVLRPSMVYALAQGRDWLPGHTDPFVAQSVGHALGREEDVLDHDLIAGEPAGQGVLGIRLVLRPGLTAPQIQELATRVGERLASDGEFRVRVDGVSFVLATG
ncbi:MAG: SseB family protein [Actinomycetia bacterium]|nr:SseB family protein [Actinomycetes bacterium]